MPNKLSADQCNPVTTAKRCQKEELRRKRAPASHDHILASTRARAAMPPSHLISLVGLIPSRQIGLLRTSVANGPQPSNGLVTPRPQRPRQHRHPIALALPVSDQNGRLLEVDVLHAQRAAFNQSPPTPVHQLRHQPADARQVLEHLAHLLAGQHHGETRRPLRAHHRAEVVQPSAQHLALQEQQRTAGLTLRRGADMSLGREMRQERVHLKRAERIGVPLLMEENETAYPRRSGTQEGRARSLPDATTSCPGGPEGPPLRVRLKADPTSTP